MRRFCLAGLSTIFSFRLSFSWALQKAGFAASYRRGWFGQSFTRFRWKFDLIRIPLKSVGQGNKT